MRCDYGAADEAATRLLLRQRLHSLRFDIRRLRFDRPIRFDTMQHYCAVTMLTMDELRRHSDTRDALTLRLRRGGQTLFIVLYNAEASHEPRRRFTLAHELGHIHLGHRRDGDAEEREANRFAAQLLLPRILVARLLRDRGGFVEAGELAGIFGVSRSAAENCLASLRHAAPDTEADRELLRRAGGLLPPGHGPLITV